MELSDTKTADFERCRCIAYLEYEARSQHLQTTASDSYNNAIQGLDLNEKINQENSPKIKINELNLAIDETQKILKVAKRLLHERFTGIDIPEAAYDNSEKWKLVYWTYHEWLKTVLSNYTAMSKKEAPDSQMADTMLYLLHERLLDAQMEQFRLMRELNLSTTEIGGLRPWINPDEQAAETKTAQ
jgi:hypothetical protein